MRAHRPPYSLVNLACGFLAGPWNLRSLIERGKRACLLNGNTVRKLVRQLISTWPGSAPAYDDLLALLRQKLSPGSLFDVGIRRFYWVAMTMSPRGPAAQAWPMPPLTSPGQLAEWLGLTVGQLDWLADCRGLNAREPSAKVRNYCCRWQPRCRGRFRLVESPKAKLKIVQRKILHDILDRIPPHPAAHGFRAGRSILTYAAPHAGQRMVLRFDLRDFFPTVRRSRIHGLFRTAGYPHDVARLLTGLCTSRVPLDVWEQRPDPRPGDEKLGDRLRGPHLPQGSPTSPALANLCAYRLDIRLAGLAESVQAIYTRYADDLAFSGGTILDRFARRFQVAVAVIAAEEGFDLHFQKSRFMRQGLCQQLAGIVVNRHPNVRRAVYDELKAILTNCVRHGPATQNRTGHGDFHGHLLGRIAHVGMIHAARGARLRALFDRITWP